MHRLFNPGSVVLIGVSDRADNLARIIFENLLEFQFTGQIYLVGRTEGSLLGRRIYGGLDDLPEGIDVAVILTPAAFVPQTVEACGKKRIPWVIIETGGFREYSGEGAHLEEEILRIARHHGIRIVGPNGIGLINLDNGFVVPFLSLKRNFVRRGRVSILSQSGGVMIHYLNHLCSANVGIAKMVSMGNKLDLDEIDYLHYLIEDPQTEIIGLYLESLERGRELMEVARSTSKPIIVHKANVGGASQEIARYHTAALINDDRVVDAALKQAGLIRVKDFRSFIDMIKILTLPPMKGNQLVILSRSGGIAIVGADTADRYGFRLILFSRAFQDQIHSYFRAKVIQPTNPLDLGDLFDFDLYTRILEEVLKNETVHGVLFQHGSSGEEKAPSRELVRAVQGISYRYQKPVAFCYLPDEEELALIKRTNDYPLFSEPEDALRALAASRDHFRRRNHPQEGIPCYDVDKDRVESLFEKARREGRELLLTEALEVVAAYGIKKPESQKIERKKKLKEAMATLRKPVALKIVSPGISHKSDVGGVALNLRTLSEARAAYDRLRALSSGKSSEILMQEMVLGGIEIILGAKRDPSFGPVIVFGMGGIYVEIFQESSLRVAPLRRSEAEEMVLESRARSILMGARGEGPRDIETLIDYLCRLSQLMIDFPQIEGVDINPLIVLGQGARAVDARIFFRK